MSTKEQTDKNDEAAVQVILRWMSWGDDCREEALDIVTQVKAALTPSATGENVPSKRESIVTTIGDDSILYLQLMNFEEGETVEVMVTPRYVNCESSKT